MQRLPLLKVIWGTFAFPLMFRVPWFRAIHLPLLPLIAVILAWNLTDESTGGFLVGLLYLNYLVATSWLAVRTHRLVLMGPAEQVPIDLLREARFVALYLATLAGLWLIWWGLAWLIAISASRVILMSTLDLSSAPGASPPAFDPRIQQWLNYAGSLSTLPGSYLVARLTPLLPAIALERGWSALAAWRLSHGNGWRLALVVLGLPYAFTLLMQLLSHDGSSSLEIALFAIAFALLAALEVIAMSLAYRELESPAPPPTPPPG